MLTGDSMSAASFAHKKVIFSTLLYSKSMLSGVFGVIIVKLKINPIPSFDIPQCIVNCC